MLGLQTEVTEKKMKDLLFQRINKTMNTIIINMRYFAKYQPNAGFKFALDGVHNYSRPEPLVGIYCLNPPAVYYGGD